MRKSRFLKEIMNRVMLVGIIGFVSVSVSLAQETIAEKIDYAKALFGGYMSSSKEEQKAKVISFFENCSEEQRESILSYMVQAITDSLQAENKQFAMNYIDNYRTIADPDDAYLGSLIITEGRYYYDQMDASKLSELSNYLSDIAAKSSLDYSSEKSELNRMTEEVAHGCDDLIGYWVADFSDKVKADPFFLHIFKDTNGEYHVDIDFVGNNVWRYVFYSPFLNLYYFNGTYKSEGCLQSRPNILSFCWSSEKMNVGKEELASFLRTGVRSVSNKIIGELARSNTYSFGTSLLGSTGTMVGEVLLNSLIDNLSVSKKKIRTIKGDIEHISKNTLSASLFFNDYIFQSDNTDVKSESCQFIVNLVRCDFKDDYVKNNIVFVDGPHWLRQRESFTSKDKKIFYKQHPEVRKAMKKIFWAFKPRKAARAFNSKQLEKLKEYNKTH